MGSVSSEQRWSTLAPEKLGFRRQEPCRVKEKMLAESEMYVSHGGSGQTADNRVGQYLKVHRSGKWKTICTNTERKDPLMLAGLPMHIYYVDKSDPH